MSIILKSEVNRLIKYTEFEENLEILENNYILNKLKLPDTIINDDTNIFELRGSTGEFTFIGDGYYYPLIYNDSGSKNIPVNYGVSYIANVKGAYSADNLITQIVPKNLSLYSNIDIVDTTSTFFIKSGFNLEVRTITLQPDGKILVGGRFTTFNGINRNRLVRLNSDGTEDTTFYTNLGSGLDDGFVSTISLQSNGKILIGGDFLEFNGNTRNYLVILNSDGTEDTTFYNNLGDGFNAAITNISLQTDGKILVGGYFTTFNNNIRNYLVRLNIDGTEDTTFYNNLGDGFNDYVSTISLQPDGKILVGGGFTIFNEINRNRLIRLNINGTEDSTFNNNLGSGFNAVITSISLQTDGKILVGGYFNSFNGNNTNKFTRLNSDGTEDSIFNDNLLFNVELSISVNFISTIEMQYDGKILVGGVFTYTNGNTISNLFRLNINGTHDVPFYANINGLPYKVVVQPNGKILIGGAFTEYEYNVRNRLVRINNDDTDDTYNVVRYISNTNGVLSLIERQGNLCLFSTSNIQYMIYDISILKTIGGSTKTTSSSGSSTSS